jgi:hypothetical protein
MLGRQIIQAAIDRWWLRYTASSTKMNEDVKDGNLPRKATIL